MNTPQVIQGGMGIGVSNWRLAHAVSSAGQLGVISGIGLDGLLARRLQDGDIGGHMRRALAAFPFQEAAQRIIHKYFVPGGIARKHLYARIPQFTLAQNDTLNELNVAANFSEAWLAKEGHNGPVGVNYLEKVQLPNLSSLYGALLAGIDYVIMGAGIPIEIPGILRKLSHNEPADMTIAVDNASKDEKFFAKFDPRALFGDSLPSLKTPKFLPIVSSTFLASIMIKKSNGPIDGLIIEGPSAGGHNAPPRGKLILNDRREPVYGARDELDMEKLRELGIPFWLAGSYGSPEGLQEALSVGAAGIQVGTPFAVCEESGITEELKAQIRTQVQEHRESVRTDIDASPTGFPFKVMELSGTLSETEVYSQRERICNLGYLREPYKKDDGSLGYRCPAERIESFLSKGGTASEGLERKQCLCNALYATVGEPTAYENGYVEKALVTIGSCLDSVRTLLQHRDSYTARDVIDYIMGPA
ncbi:MAG: nitronate monooxygenase [Spirochaetia bacterium]|nr:nitronate monooxygenase [Spirochaetia bacterium]